MPIDPTIKEIQTDDLQEFNIDLTFLVSLKSKLDSQVGDSTAEYVRLSLELKPELLINDNTKTAFEVNAEMTSQLDKYYIKLELPKAQKIRREVDAKRVSGEGAIDDLSKNFTTAITRENKTVSVSKPAVQTKIQNADSASSKGVPASKQNTQKAVTTVTEEFTPKVQKCMCVHGPCARGTNNCEKCENGWHGKLCDIKNDLVKKVKKIQSSQVDGEEV